jgi:hypothetical protein
MNERKKQKKEIVGNNIKIYFIIHRGGRRMERGGRIFT